MLAPQDCWPGRSECANLVEAIMRHVLQDDGLHGEHVGELHLGDVEGAHHMGPAWGGVGTGLSRTASTRPRSPQHQAVDAPCIHNLPVPTRAGETSLHPTSAGGLADLSRRSGLPHLHCQSSSMPHLCVGTAHTSANARSTGDCGNLLSRTLPELIQKAPGWHKMGAGDGTPSQRKGEEEGHLFKDPISKYTLSP